MSRNQEFIDRLQKHLVDARRRGAPAREVRVNPEQAKLIEAEFAIQHGTDGMSIENVPIVLDPSLPFGDYVVVS